jgi:ATP-binding protein involved in chromosome partitioning
MTDPRVSIINERLAGIDKIVAVSSGKGGVGKSLVASTLTLALGKRGYRTGLFDLDFTSPSTHMILGIKNVQPKEDKGIIPPKIHGLQYMSIIYYSGDHATPLRGSDVSDALIELLSITRWEKLDYLMLDMPPGIGDATLDLIRLMKNIEFLVVTTPSQLAFETVKKLVSLLRSVRIPIIGIVENMKMRNSDDLRQRVKELNVSFLGEIPYDFEVEENIGKADRLMKTVFAQRVSEISLRI